MTGVQWEPVRSNYPAIDVVLSNGGLCNVTVSSNHDIVVAGSAGEGLAAISRKLPGSSPIHFYWAVPNDVFPSITAGNFVLNGKKLDENCTTIEHARHLPRIKQWALCVETAKSGKPRGPKRSRARAAGLPAPDP